MPMTIGPIQLFSQATPAQRRTMTAAALGWMLDSFDAMLYALVLAHVMRDLGMTKSTAGLLNSLTLFASGIGGVLFGFIADRIGRRRALMASIRTDSVCSFAAGLSTTVLMLAVFRLGGEQPENVTEQVRSGAALPDGHTYLVGAVQRARGCRDAAAQS